GRAHGVVDAEVASGAQLDHHQVGDCLAGAVVEVGRQGPGRARGEGGEEGPGGGVGDRDVDDHGGHAAGGHAAVSGGGDVDGGVGADLGRYAPRAVAGVEDASRWQGRVTTSDRGRAVRVPPHHV